MKAVIICVGGGKEGIISLHSQEELDAFLARPEVKSAQLVNMLQEGIRRDLMVHVEERLFEDEEEPKRKKPRNKPKRPPPPPRHNNRLPKKGKNRGFR